MELMFISIHKAEQNKLIQYTGEFYEGKIISGKWILSNKTTYEGNFKHN